MKRTPLRRGAVVFAMVLAAVVYFWQEGSTPVENPVVLVLTELEVPAEGALLRYESVRALQVVLRSPEGEVVATVRARGGAAVVPAAPIVLPKGSYLAELTATLTAPSGAAVKRVQNRRITLDGKTLELRF